MSQYMISVLISLTSPLASIYYVLQSNYVISLSLIFVSFISARYSGVFLGSMQYTNVAHSIQIDSELHNVYLTLPFDPNAPRIVPIYQIVKQPLKDMNDALKYICVGVDGKSYLFQIADLTLFNTIIDPQVFAITLGDEGNQNLNTREEESP